MLFLVAIGDIFRCPPNDPVRRGFFGSFGGHRKMFPRARRATVETIFSDPLVTPEPAPPRGAPCLGAEQSVLVRTPNAGLAVPTPARKTRGTPAGFYAITLCYFGVGAPRCPC
ncbi:JM26 [macacine gammaherpesvirus 11]|uniref:JM26 n=2 Tax=macacine gammaherpesvirus 11 TaxID=2560570 RepID=G9JM34_9GAMA|nr:JM26 [Macaca fuscata rhadinovirus]AAT00003.1 JM26 [Macaca fuscata rhadinovirus]AEW87551.1 JM26 [Macaca fuscata rhadinovirus]AEW87721.1 JM26 [Macaca fuscata rhadinovirus]